MYAFIILFIMPPKNNNNAKKELKQTKTLSGKPMDSKNNAIVPVNNFQTIYQTKMKNFILDKKYIEKEIINSFNFKTRNSSGIKYQLLKFALRNIDRINAIEEIMKLVNNVYIAHEIENGLFEFALVSVATDKSCQDKFVVSIYQDKLYDICVNLDINDPYVENTTFLPTIMDPSFDVYYVAFFSPDQMHPKRWAPCALKKQIKDEAMNNFRTTDLYKCKKCKERKFKITELQLRSADEPMSTICTCMNCYCTFII